VWKCEIQLDAFLAHAQGKDDWLVSHIVISTPKGDRLSYVVNIFNRNVELIVLSIYITGVYMPICMPYIVYHSKIL
jgi:hypothetical protein